MQKNNVLNKSLIYGIFVLLVGVTVAPGITAQHDIELDEVFSELEKKLEDLDIRFYNAGSREKEVAIINEAIALLDKYELLPDDLSVEELQQLVFAVYCDSNDYVEELPDLTGKISVGSEEEIGVRDSGKTGFIVEDMVLKPSDTPFIDVSNCRVKKDKGTDIVEESITFSVPQIQNRGEYNTVYLKEESSQLMESGTPVLPVVTRVFLFPFKTKIKDVSVCFYGVKEKKISNPIRLAPEPIPSICTKMDTVALPFENGIKSYDSVLYPEKQYNYHVGAGRYDNKIVNYLSVNLYPAQYDSSDNIVYYRNKADISIRYESPQKPIALGDEYDLIIITPLWFSQELKPLVDHKNNHGIRSKLVTLNEIYGDVYFPVEGRDRAENVKYFIKHALDEWGIKYVLLVGGRKGGLFEPKWWVPVRYSHLDDNYEESYLCDLYFADIYDANGNFSSWDTTENGVFAEWKTGAKDILDMYPDVHVGRLACKNVFEVKTMVDKIIAYENTANGSEWFEKLVGVAGDTVPKNNDYYEGEMETEAAFGYLDGFNVSYLWTSTGAFADKQDVITEVNKGCGLMLFSGHSTPKEWITHPPNNKSWIGAPNTFEMDELRNGGKLPIVLVGGCHTSQFDTSLLNFLKGILENGLQYFIKPPIWSGGNFWAYEWVPKCWAWSMASQSEGGCIAIIGGSGIGYCIGGEDCLTGRGAFLKIQFFRSYSEGKDILGETHSAELIYYLNEFPPMDEKIDCKTVQQWVLLGDPSLKIGGYSSTQNNNQNSQQSISQFMFQILGRLNIC